jgi:hypothetical protein
VVCLSTFKASTSGAAGAWLWWTRRRTWTVAIFGADVPSRLRLSTLPLICVRGRLEAANGGPDADKSGGLEHFRAGGGRVLPFEAAGGASLPRGIFGVMGLVVHGLLVITNPEGYVRFAEQHCSLSTGR